jgi:lipid II:glycine glycyltransferase (peptidoglycan interpeptide bridge formation enzyme)
MSDNRKIFFLETLDPDIESRWLDYWSLHIHASWRQHPAFGHAAAAIGARNTYAVGFLDEKIALVGVFSYKPICRRFGATEAVCLRGPVFDDVSFAQWCLLQINNYFRLLKVGTVRIGPYWRFPEAEDLERALFAIGYKIFEKSYPLGRRTTGIIDIRKSNEEILKSFKNSTRYEIKKAEKLGIDHRPACGSLEAGEFFNHLDQRDKERGITRTSPKEFEAIFNLLKAHKESGAIINSYYKNSFLGGLLLFRGGRTAFLSKFVVCDNSKCLFPTLRLAPSVFFEGIQWAKSQGCEFLDIEGYSTDDKDLGDRVFVNRYKTGFNPVACQTLGQYYAVCKSSMHQVQRMFAFGEWAARLPRRLNYRVRFEFKKRIVDKKERPSKEA